MPAVLTPVVVGAAALVGATAAEGVSAIANRAMRVAADAADTITMAVPASTPRLQRPITAYFTLEPDAPTAKRRRTDGCAAVHMPTDQAVQQATMQAAAAALAVEAPRISVAQGPGGYAAQPPSLPAAQGVAVAAAATVSEAAQEGQRAAGRTAGAQAAQEQPGNLQEAQAMDESDPIEDPSQPVHEPASFAAGVIGSAGAGQHYSNGDAPAAVDLVQPPPVALHCQETMCGESGEARCSRALKCHGPHLLSDMVVNRCASRQSAWYPMA